MRHKISNKILDKIKHFDFKLVLYIFSLTMSPLEFTDFTIFLNLLTTLVALIFYKSALYVAKKLDENDKRLKNIRNNFKRKS